MTHPEKNASYSYKPKFIERMKRAEGGAADEPLEPLQNTAEKYEDGGTYLQKMRNDEGGRGLSDWRGSFGNNEKVAPMPIVTGTDTGDNMDADTSANQPSVVRGRKPLNHGGRVRNRATGGGIPGGRGPFPGQSEKDFEAGEAANQRRKISQPMGDYASFSAKQSEEGD